MNQALGLRPATANDLPAVMDIEHTAFPYGVHEPLEVYAERLQVFPQGFQVLMQDQTVAGFICTERWTYKQIPCATDFTVGHSISQQHQPHGPELYISSMGIHPRYHGQGLGKKLFAGFLHYAQSAFPELKSILLLVSEKWVPARKIYLQNGFVETQSFPKFFSNETSGKMETGIVMRKTLTQGSVRL